MTMSCSWENNASLNWEGGTWLSDGRHWLAGWQAPAMCGVYCYLGNRLVHACMIFIASIFGDIRGLTGSETVAAIRS